MISLPQQNSVSFFPVSLIEKLFEKSPISYSVVRYDSIFDPKEMTSVDAELLQSKMKKNLQHFVKLGILDNISCDKALAHFIHFIQNESTLNLDKFKSFDRKDKRLDGFYFHVLCIQKYKELAYIVEIILTLSHGQAAVERGFSVGNVNNLDCQ